MLLDRGATIPMPHDVKCSCDECVESSANDSLRFSLARINAYKALASSSLIALSSKDPILTGTYQANQCIVCFKTRIESIHRSSVGQVRSL